jgi:type VI secretion system secreted protein VgrG
MATAFMEIGGISVGNAIWNSVEVIQELNRHWWCKVKLLQTEDQRFPIESWLGQDCTIQATVESGSIIVFFGFILEGKLDYELSGGYTAELTCVTYSYKLELTHQESYFSQKGLASIANTITSVDGLTATVQCSQDILGDYVQWGETDFAFLIRLADDHQAWLRPSETGIEIYDQFQSGSTLTWRKEGEIVQFSMAGRLGQPTFQGTHYNPEKTQSQYFSGVEESPEFFGGSAPMVAAVLQASRSVMAPGALYSDTRALTAEAYEQKLKRESIRSVAANLVGHGVSRSPQVKAGDTLQIAGTLDAAGTYGVTKVVHRWTQFGYSNEFWCTPWKNWVSPVRPEHKPMDGVVVARVVDHNDPLGIGRLRVQYDWQTNSTTAWLRMAVPHAGGTRGFMFMPEVGDEVLVSFEHGDAEQPIVVGCLWNSANFAPRQSFLTGTMAAASGAVVGLGLIDDAVASGVPSDIANNNVKKIVTKSNNRLVFSDAVETQNQGAALIVPNVGSIKLLQTGLMSDGSSTGRPIIAIECTDGDILLGAPNGRVHIRSQYYSREIGTPPTGSTS